ncbi:hypothetical protein [Pseudolabrys sp.]|uniref:hypothetical protein n=1 Tax=Pseudolabrys sp. TaxID=1960880 RepID=UPI003D118FA0
MLDLLRRTDHEYPASRIDGDELLRAIAPLSKEKQAAIVHIVCRVCPAAVANAAISRWAADNTVAVQKYMARRDLKRAQEKMRNLKR